MRQDQGRSLDGLDDLRHRERLAGTGDSEQNLMVFSVPETPHQLLDGFRLVPLGFEAAYSS